MIERFFICANCGLQFNQSIEPPPRCFNCDEDRESISHLPQVWTTISEMNGRYSNIFTELGSGVTGIRTVPQFAIGQEIFLIKTSVGNYLWDCLGYIDSETVREITARGGLEGILISHPHFFGSLAQWSAALGNVPVYVHGDNQPWIARETEQLRLWHEEAIALPGGVTMIHCAGHFPGSCVLHWADGAEGRGSLFTSDTILPVEDRRWVSFMYSYPNLIPLGQNAVLRLQAAVENYQFEKLYGGPMYGSGGSRPIIEERAKQIVARSVERYLSHLQT